MSQMRYPLVVVGKEPLQTKCSSLVGQWYRASYISYIQYIVVWRIYIVSIDGSFEVPLAGNGYLKISYGSSEFIGESYDDLDTVV